MSGIVFVYCKYMLTADYDLWQWQQMQLQFSMPNRFFVIFPAKPRVNIEEFMLQTKIRGFLWTFHTFPCHGTFECVSRKDRIIIFLSSFVSHQMFHHRSRGCTNYGGKIWSKYCKYFHPTRRNHKLDDVATWKLQKDIYK